MVKEKVLHVTPRKLNEDSQNRTVWGINAVAVDERSIPETSVPCTKDAECHHCKRRGHYSVASCYKKSLSSVQQEEESSFSDTSFLDAVTQQEKESWTANLKVNDKEIPFKIDTGAEVTAITIETYITRRAKTRQITYCLVQHNNH